MNDASLKERRPSSPWKHFGNDVARRAYPVVVHGLWMMTAILVMAITELLLNLVFGHDSKFFDLIPKRYFIQAVDTVMFARFTLHVWHDLR